MSLHMKDGSRTLFGIGSDFGFVRQTTLLGRFVTCRFSERVKPRQRAASQRRLTAVLAAMLLVQMLLPVKVMAQGAPQGNMDLSSKDRNITVDHHPDFQATDIRVGRQTRTVNAGDMLTAAEYAALQQVLTTGAQTLKVGREGNAVRGSLNLTPELTNVLHDLVIPNRVTVVNDFAVNSVLDMTGSLTNSGKFYAVSSNSSVTDAIINANNIFNNGGALLTSVLPSGGLAGFTNLASSLNLTLNAVNDIVNAGVISSSGNLNLNAGGSIVNQAAATIQAAQNVNLNSAIGNIVNSGLVSSLAGNINIATQTVQNILINNVGGVMEALAGQINVRDALFGDKADLKLTGGDWLSRELNLYSGTGIINADVKNITGTVNVQSHVLHLFAEAPTVTLGSMQLTGDPLFASTGDFIITADISTFGADLAIVAGGSILTGDADPFSSIAINTTPADGDGGDITFVAGAQFTGTSLTGVTITGASCDGGNIDLTGASVTDGDPIDSLSSHASNSATLNQNGGNIVLAAFAGGLAAGTIKTPASVTITSFGENGGNNGNVTILSGTPSGLIPDTVSINIGGVNTEGADSTPGTGNITISTATPDVGSGVFIDSNGTITSGSFAVGTLQQMSISTGSLEVDGANINVTAGRDLLVTGDVQAYSGGDAGNVTLQTNSSNTFVIGGATVNGVTGFIDASVSASGDGGTVSVTNSGTGGISLPNPSDIDVSAEDGDGGTIILDAGQQGTLTIGGGTLAANADGFGGSSNFDGGQITLSARKIDLPTGNLLLSADGADSGDGGQIEVTSTSPNADLVIGANSGEFEVSAESGDVDDANGGSVEFSSGRKLTVDPNFIDLDLNGTDDGDGGSITLTSTNPNLVGKVFVSGSITLNGLDDGDGGFVKITSASPELFVVGTDATDHGVFGTISVNAGPEDGDGGQVQIASLGNVAINDGISANAGGFDGTGGQISVSSTNGGVFTDATISATGGSTSGNGGQISLSAGGPQGIVIDSLSNLDVSVLTEGSGGTINLTATNGPLTIPSGTLAVNAVDNNGGSAFQYNGGTINITALALNVTGGGSLDLQANGPNQGVGPDDGNGGTVFVDITGAIPNLAGLTAADRDTLFVDDEPGGITISAESGDGDGNGGTVTVRSGRNLVVDPDDVDADPQGEGNGANYTFASGTALSGTLLIRDDLFADGDGTGNGGSITLNVNSNVVFEINASGSVTNGVDGALIAVSGGTAGNGGTVSVTNTGFGGIFVADTELIGVNAAGGTGGTINLDAGQGQLTIFADSGNGGFNADAGDDGGNNQGGTITLVGRGIDILNDFLPLSANGVNNGNGGTVTITNQGAVGGTLADLVIDDVTGGFTISARPGIDGNNGGNGGIVRLSTGRNMFINVGVLNATPESGVDGDGAQYFLTAGTALPGNIAVSGTLDARAGDDGNGGRIEITMNSSLTFGIDNSSVLNGDNGIDGQLLANSPETGNNGTVIVTNLGTGGIFVPDPGSIDVQSDEGGGGAITLAAPNGLLEIDTDITASLVARGDDGDFSGGTITLTARDLLITGGANPALLLDAHGDGDGNGGTVNVTASNPGSLLDLGTDAAEIQIDVRSGSGTGGSGGNVNLTSGGTIFANQNDNFGPGILFSAQGTGGNGGNLDFQAGENIIIINDGINVSGGSGGNGNGGTVKLKATAGTIFVDGDINANGNGDGNGGTVDLESTGGTLFVDGVIQATGSGDGNGGTIRLVSNAGSAFQVGFGASLNGVNGFLRVESFTQGNGGSISITNNGPGGVQIFNLNDLNLGVDQGTGGDLTIAAPVGTVSLDEGSVFVDADGSDFAGGSIDISGQFINIDTSDGNVEMSANGAGDGAGGQISLVAQAINVSGDNNVLLFANGAGDGDGGTITLAATEASLEVDNGANQFILSATGGSFGSAAGNGGIINLTAGPNLFVDIDFLDAGPLGDNGNGAQLSFTALNGSLVVDGVDGDILVDGVGSGAGGLVAIDVNSSSAFSINNGLSLNGVSGFISANGGDDSGQPTNGGTVTITQNGSGGILFGDFSANPLVSVNGGNDGGNGGTITINTGAGGLINDSDDPIILAEANCGIGGTVTLNMASLTTLAGAEAIQIFANGGGGGAGGTVNLTLASVCQDLVIGTGGGAFQIFAEGGESGSISGDGGTVTLSSARDLIVDTSDLDVGPTGDSGGGATLSFTAARFISINGNLNVDGVGFGNGGSVTLSSQSTRAFTYNGVSAHHINGTISTNAGPDGGNGGSISLQFPNATLIIEGNTTLSANGVGLSDLPFDGGSITLNVGRLEQDGGKLTLAADSTGAGATGNGGIIDVTLNRPGESIFVADLGDALEIRARGGLGGGNGGTVNLTAPRNVIIDDPNSLLAGPRSDGNGANLSFTATNGFVFFGGNLDVSGLGAGNGGSVTISSGATGHFDVGPDALAGVNGNILANAGGSGGTGGTITITTSGALRFRGGGQITADAASNGDTSSAFDGGTISITALRMRVLDEGNFTISANSAELGNGGTITVSSTGVGTVLEVGSLSGQLQISATGGYVDSLGGNGGSVTISATNLTVVDPAFLNVGALGDVGDGAIISLTATGRLSINGDLRADAGDEFGNGGQITLTSNSAQPFNVGGGGVNGVDGEVSARAGEFLGNGGSITIQNNGGGGIFVESGSISVSAGDILGGDGGSITLTANNGAVGFDDGVGLSANASEQGIGGQIQISAGRLNLLDGTHLLSANGAGTGNGGQVSVTTTGGSTASSIVVGTSAGQLAVSATGGSVGSLAGNGGSVTISSGRDLTVDPAGISAGPAGLSGNGAAITLTNGTVLPGTMLITDNLSADGVGNGNGGSITLNVTSNGLFVIEDSGSVTNGVDGSLTANAAAGSAVDAGHGDGNGGTVAVVSTGFGGIVVNDTTLISASADGDGGNGAGGTITLDAGVGQLTIVTSGGDFNVDARGAGNSQGGTITLAGTPVILETGPLDLNANGVNGGNGGSVTVTSQGPLAGIVVDDDQNGFEIFARSGDRGGNGGIITVSSGLDLVVDEDDLDAGVEFPSLNDGNGPTYSLTAGTALPGNVVVFDGDLNASAGRNGNGGTINITMNWPELFMIDPGFVPENGIDGSLIAEGGAISGNGGTVRVTNFNTGEGIVLVGVSGIGISVAVPTQGAGGTIALLAPNGRVVIDAQNVPVLSANGVGTGPVSGGTITLNGRDLVVGSLTNEFLLLDVRGASTGDGGTVNLASSGPQLNLIIGTDQGEIQIDARSGSLGGNGGTVNVTCGTNIFVDLDDDFGPGILAGPQGPNGNGANYNFTAGDDIRVTNDDLNAAAVGNGNGGTVNMQAGGELSIEGDILAHGSGTGNGNGGTVSLQAGGDLFIEGDILAQGSGIGNGGSITLVPNSNNPFVIFPGFFGSNGVDGVLDVSAGSVGGAGTISLTTSGFGIVNIPDLGVLQLQVTQGSGGNVTIAAPNGTLSTGGGMPAGTLSVDAGGTSPAAGNFAGGSINISVRAFDLNTSNGDVFMNANGSDDGAGGSISLVARFIDVPGDNNVLLSANAAGNGNGGTITLGPTQSSLEIGDAGGQFILSATGGSFGSSAGNGGTINLTAGTSMFVDTGFLDANPLGNGNGATLSFTVASGPLGILGDLSADGAGSGAGGSITINVRSSTPFSINNGDSQSGVSGVIHANGGSDPGAINNGGTVTINQTGSGGILFAGNNPTLISVLPAFDGGAGGTITINTGSGGLINVTTGTQALLVADGFCGNAGTVTLNMASLTNEPGAAPIQIFARGFDGGAGGTVNLTLASVCQDLVIGDGEGEFTIFAASTDGNGGSVTLQSGRDLIVNMAFLESAPQGDDGDGATLSFTATRFLSVSGNLNADGVGFGNGGSVTLSSQSTRTFEIGLGATGHGVDGFIVADAGPDGGNGGTISLQFPNATLRLPGGSILSANALGTDAFDGGSITLNANRIETDGAGAITLSANGSGIGNGGTVSVTKTRQGENIVVGDGDGEFTIFAEGGADGGAGGFVSLTAPRNVTIDPNFLSAGPQGGTGNGASFIFTALNGVVFFNDDLDVSGVGYGNGGSVSIQNGGTGNFDIGAGATGAGVNGNIFANGGALGGNGGSVTIATGDGSRGALRLRSGATIEANAVSVNDAQALNGGDVGLNAPKLAVLAGSNVSVSANGAGLGDGGSITLAASDTGTSLVVGGGFGQVSLSATGGFSDSLGGSGGSVAILATNLTIDNPSFLSVGPLGLVGNGGSISLTAGANGSAGRLFVNGALSADAADDFGGGGTITLVSNSAQSFIVGAGGGATVNGVDGDVSANAGGVLGNGGSITIQNDGSGGVTVASGASSVTVSAGGILGGDGGDISLTANNGAVSLDTTGLSAAAFEQGNGGQITISAGRLSLPFEGVVPLSADGAATGNGGQVSVTTLGGSSASSIALGTSGLVEDGELVVSAFGGFVEYLFGDGGTVTISSARDLTVDVSGLAVSPAGFSGNGGTINLTAGTAFASKLFVDGDLDADGVGAGDGGTINISVNSNQLFEIDSDGIAGTNGVEGNLLANGVNGGTVSVQNTGFGGIDLQTGDVDPVIQVNALNGAGGSITLDAGGGQFAINVVDSIGLNADAGPGGNFQGGSITLIGSGISITNGPLLLSANGVNGGAGGSVTVTNQGAGSGLFLDGLGDSITISATSGALGGDGGTVNLSAGRNLLIDVGNLVAGVQSPSLNSGDGATYNLTAGTAQPGNVSIFNGNLDASAGLNGNGGTINVTMNSSEEFRIDPDFVPDNGIDGSLIAQGGSVSGNGGTVTVTNNGTGGIDLRAETGVGISVAALNQGSGGTITLVSPVGRIEINTSTVPELSANGVGTGNVNGGTISIIARDLDVDGNDFLRLNVRGADTGSGGTVNLTSSGLQSELNIGSEEDEEEIQIDARSGDAGGNGGTVNLTSGTLIFVDLNDDNGPGIQAGPQGPNGNGATYNFTAGTDIIVFNDDLNANAVGNGAGGTVNLQAGRDLFVDGNILAQGSGTGAGGSITLVSGGTNTFVLDPGAVVSGVTGDIKASAGFVGNAGTISITNNGVGGVRIDDLDVIRLGVSRGAGGTLSINAPNGVLSIGNGGISANGAGGGLGDAFNGGTISLAAGAIVIDNIFTDVEFGAVGSGDGAGGNISLVAQSIAVDLDNDNVFLDASAAGEGDGGTVTVSALGSNSELEIGFGDSQFVIDAAGGSFGSQQGDGGTVALTAGRSMFVDLNGLEAGPEGDNGNGANLSFTVTNGSPCCGNLVVDGNLHADAVGQGSGGSITISVNSQLPFTIGEPETFNGILGNEISANGGFSRGPANNGGSISIVNNGSGGIRSGDNVEFRAEGGAGFGNGGTINIQTGSGGLLTEELQIFAFADDCGNGGSVTLNMASLAVLPNADPVVVVAAGSGQFNGGTVNISLASPTQDLVIGDDPGQFVVIAPGGESGGLAGDGGTVTLSSGRDLIVNTNDLFVGPQGDNGGGATLSFTAVRNLFVDNNLNVDGVGFGDGGSVALSSSNTATFRVLPGATVHGVNGFISANAGVDGGNGGSISLNFSAGIVQVAGGSVFSADAAGSSSAFNGGSVTLNAFRITTTGPGPILLSANGSGFGNGGLVSVTLTRPNENLTVGSGDGEFIISTVGEGDGGNGGIVSLTTPGNLTIEPAFLTAGPDGSNGDGATLSFATTTGVVLFDGDLIVSGVGAGDGGSVSILSGGAGTFDIGPGAAGQGVNGFIDASAGVDGGNGGTISIAAGGLTGTMRFFDDDGDIFANAVAADGDGQAFNGGSITLTSSKFQVSNTAQVTLSANGASLGNGGSIVVTTTGAGGSDIEIGFLTGQMDISATGGSSNALGGDGGTVSISATNLDVDPNALLVGPQGDVGDGATITLLAGTAGASGRLFVSGNLSADAGDQFGNGGVITLASRNGQTFDVGADAGATVNGVDGTISADAGAQLGNGGSITIRNDNGGGVRFGASPALSVTTGFTLGGDGGSITVVSNNGRVEFEGAGLTADAFEQGAGGQISVTGERLVLPDLGALVLSANGAGNGNGGTVSVFTVGSGGNASLLVDDVLVTGAISLSATGGSVDSLSGDGGTIIVSSGRDLTVVDFAGLTAGPQGLSGAGASINLTAGTAGNGDLFVDGNLSADGVGAGNGGTISLTSNSGVRFDINFGAAVNGVGFLSASAAGTAGNGGSVTITNNGSGGVGIGSNPISVNASTMGGGNGGAITISAAHASGDVEFEFDGLQLAVDAFAGANSVPCCFDGGQISVTAGRGIVGPGSGAVTLSALSLGSGQPGSISLTTVGTGAASEIAIGLDAGEFALSAPVDTTGLAVVGTGGTVSVSSGAHLAIDPAGIIVGGVGQNRNGGTINLTAGDPQVPNLGGRIFVDGTLVVNGEGVGNGGTINLTSKSNLRFNVFPGATTNGVNGSLVAVAGGVFGNGGSISITNLGAGGIGFDAAPDILVDPSGNGGNGGSITLSATAVSATIQFAGAGLNANAFGGESNGGTITISATSLVFNPAFVLEFNAVGFGGGAGGNVSIQTTAKGSNLVVGADVGQIRVDASGGGDFQGDGGNITISAGKNLTVDGSALLISSDGNVQGGTINLTAGAVGTGNLILRNNSLFAGFGADDAINVSVGTKGKITTQGLGVVYEARTVNLDNPGGDIGSKNAPILTNALTLSANGSKNVFLRELSEVALGASSATKTFQLVSNGITVVTGDVSASKLLLTTLNDSSIAIAANLNGTKDGVKFTGTITLDADGLGSILQLTGQMTAKTVTLTSDTGNIGLQHSNVIVSSGDSKKAVTLNANTGGSGNVFVAALSAMTVKSASAGGTLSLEACGALTAKKPLLAGDVFLSVSPESDADIKAKVAAGATVSVFAPNPGSNVTLTGLGPVVLDGVAVGGTYKVSAPGTITVNDVLNAGVLTLKTTKNNGDILVNDDINATTSVSLTANGSGDILCTGDIETPTLTAKSKSGDIELIIGSNFINTVVTAKTGGAVDIVAVEDVTITKSKAGTDFTVDAEDDVTLIGVSTKNGDITVSTEEGTLLVAAKGKVSAKEGDITLFGEDPESEIFFDTGAKVTAKAKTLGLGDVTIFIVNNNGGEGSAPGNVQVVQKNGGDVRFGSAGITANAPTNKLTAKGAVLQFDASDADSGADAIVLNGKVKITADPPGVLGGALVGGPVPALNGSVVTPDGASNIVLGSPNGPSHTVLGSPDGGRGASHAPGFWVAGALPSAPTDSANKNELRVNVPANASIQVPMLSFPGASITRGIDTIPFVTPDSSVVTPNGGRGASHAPAETADAGLQPVAYAPPVLNPGSAGGCARFAVETTKAGGTVVKHAGAAVTFDGSDVVNLNDGEALVASSHNSVVRAGRHYVVTVASGAMALVSMQNGVLKVRSVYEGLRSPVRVLVDGRSVSLSAGQELIVGRGEQAVKAAMREDNVGRRKVKSFVVDGQFQVLRADVSLVSLLQRSDVLARVTRSQSDDNKSIAAKLMKMAACVMQVTSGRGAYSVADPAKVTSEEIKTPRRFNTVADARL